MANMEAVAVSLSSLWPGFISQTFITCELTCLLVLSRQIYIMLVLPCSTSLRFGLLLTLGLAPPCTPRNHAWLPGQHLRGWLLVVTKSPQIFGD